MSLSDGAYGVMGTLSMEICKVCCDNHRRRTDGLFSRFDGWGVVDDFNWAVGLVRCGESCPPCMIDRIPFDCRYFTEQVVSWEF
jgi:hypothetical protein